MATIKSIISGFLGLKKDPNATTQDVAVIKAEDTNAGLVLQPNGTGAIMASVPDGTFTGGGNARGQYAVDLKPGGRTAQSQVASGDYSAIIGGNVSTASGFCSLAGGSAFATGTNSVALGGSSFASGSGSVAIGGEQGGGLGATASGRAAIAFGLSNTATANFSNSLGGLANNATSQYSTISGGQSNTASTGTHATVVGGQSNTSSGQHSVSGGWLNQSTANRSISFGEGNISSANQSTSFGGYNTASGERSFAVGSNNTANAIRSSAVGGLSNTAGGQYSITLGGTNNSSSGISSLTFGQSNNAGQLAAFAGGLNANSYLYSQFSLSSGQFNSSQLSQFTILHPRRESLLTSGQTIDLSLDGTGITNLITTYNSKGIWNITANWCAIVTSITGTATGVNLGDSITQNSTLAFKHYGGSASILGSINTLSTNADTSMNTSLITFSASGSNTLNISFTAPTFLGGGSVNIQVLCNLIVTQIQLP